VGDTLQRRSADGRESQVALRDATYLAEMGRGATSNSAVSAASPARLDTARTFPPVELSMDQVLRLYWELEHLEPWERDQQTELLQRQLLRALGFRPKANPLRAERETRARRRWERTATLDPSSAAAARRVIEIRRREEERLMPGRQGPAGALGIEIFAAP
jgi:hypothetical protein